MSSPVSKPSPNGLLKAVRNGTWWILTSLPAGESYKTWLQLRHPINVYKGICFAWCILCMYMTGQWTYPAIIYTACHGSYGILWLTREVIFRDPMWESPCTGGSALFLFFGMGVAFLSNPVLLVTGGSKYEPSPAQLMVITTIFIFGNWLHNSADVQKYFVLKAKPGLISDGMFSRCRNPNYLGELLILGSLGAFVWNHPMWWFPWIWLSIIFTFLFIPSAMAKDISMSRYPEWSKYTSVSGLLFPWTGKRVGDVKEK